MKCKDKCICNKPRYEAVGMKQCPVCQDILKSTYGKAKCQVKDRKPTMILPTAAVACSSRKKYTILQSDRSALETEESDDETSM